MKKILVGVDGSEKAQEALDKAIEIAEKMGSEIEIINVIEPLTFPAGMYPATTAPPSPTWVTQYYDEYHKEHKKMLNEVYEKVKDGHPKLKITKKVVEGLPATEIVAEAKNGGFDLIVVGARGMGFVEELILGSTSSIIVDKSTVPVLVVK
jgi:nucleotide-binding universal stress UspA family protein